MSASKHVTLWCDFAECNAWTDHGDREVRATRRMARSEGWVYRGGGDFCCLDHAEGRRTHDQILQDEWNARHRAS